MIVLIEPVKMYRFIDQRVYAARQRSFRVDSPSTAGYIYTVCPGVGPADLSLNNRNKKHQEILPLGQ